MWLTTSYNCSPRGSNHLLLASADNLTFMDIIYMYANSGGKGKGSSRATYSTESCLGQPRVYRDTLTLVRRMLAQWEKQDGTSYIKVMKKQKNIKYTLELLRSLLSFKYLSSLPKKWQVWAYKYKN